MPRRRDIYQSPLFHLSRAFVEARCDEWAILSAKHGLVMLSDVVEPYDLTPNGMSASERLA